MELKAAGLTTVIQNIYRAYWHKREQLQARITPWPVLITVLIMAIHLVLLPFVARTWRATGDEPHYLLAAHSLVVDGDFDLTNNYDQFDYLVFYFSKDITRQVRTDSAGRQILDHHLGLPLLIAPAYALAGRLGVLLFQIGVGGLLTWLTCKLAFVISQDEKAALLATLSVVLTPPLFLYHYLVYPELIGALLTTLVLYLVITRSKPGFSVIVLALLALMILPWLNRRFIPLTILLFGLIAWAWRSYFTTRRLSTLLSLAAIITSIALLLWFNSQFAEPTRIDFTAPTGGTQLWRRLARGIGWLFDQQRGLFIYAPVYLLAVWGLPVLISNSLSRLRQTGRNRTWFLLLPFLLLLGITAAAGGFWVAWELGPRFLVVALPALAPLIALAWRRYGHSAIWNGLGLALLALSVANTIILVNNSELPYKSSLTLYYGDKLQLSLIEYLPDFADDAQLWPLSPEIDPTITPAAQSGAPRWLVPAGNSRPMIKSEPLSELPFGHYALTWLVRGGADLPPETELARISVNFLGGGQLFNKVITPADLRPEVDSLVQHTFLNPNVDRWRTPMILQVISSGQADLEIGPVRLTPVFFHAWFLPYLYLSLIVAGACLTWFKVGRSVVAANRGVIHLASLPAGLGWGVLLGLLLASLAYLGFQQNRRSHTYSAAEFQHFVGQAIADPETETGRAWLVDPMTDPPQKAIYGPFDIYEAGQYQVAFRIKLPETAAGLEGELARLQVNATANFEALITQPLQATDFSRPNLYHDFILSFNNPRQQALSFDVYYLGLAALVIDQVTITKIAE